MGRIYATTAVMLLIVACVVMATRDVVDTSLQNSKSQLAKLLTDQRLTEDRPRHPAFDGEPIKRDSPEKPEWDTDYGWGGGRFGKRRLV